ncbi:MAG: putative transport protein [Francisellaceae bacterium]|nr:putative transport protein [Francisellaceae bacterium]
MTSFSLNSLEQKTILILGSIFSIRLFSIFLVLPLFENFAHALPYATPFLVGLALGCAGLMQAFLQLPFGLLSDYFGRRKIVVIGLSLLGLGSVIMALSNNIYSLIIGRILQGCAAIGSVIIAWLSDIIREELRPKALGLLGISIGLTFALSMILGPLFNQTLSTRGIFWLMTYLSLIGLWFTKKVPLSLMTSPSVNLKTLLGLLKNKPLLKINYGAFVVHASLTALFLILPKHIHQISFFNQRSWAFYLMVLTLSLCLTIPGIFKLDKRRMSTQLYLVSITILIVSELMLMFFKPSLLTSIISLSLFFGAFNLIEVLLPAMVAHYAPIYNRGAAQGANTTCQFIGIFLGGALGGWLNGIGGSIAVIGFCVILALSWLGLELAFLVKQWLIERNVWQEV